VALIDRRNARTWSMGDSGRLTGYRIGRLSGRQTQLRILP
jgi:hypothetical protein